MRKRLLISLCAALWLGQAASNSIEYNIARGLQPEAKGQAISVLKPFYGDFRILGSKQYFHDEQAKFSPIDYAVSRACLHIRILHRKSRSISMTAI